jgi:hypothetical protein
MPWRDQHDRGYFFTGACFMEVICCTFRLRGPAFRILEKQNHMMVNRTENGIKLDSSATGFAFQGF